MCIGISEASNCFFFFFFFLILTLVFSLWVTFSGTNTLCLYHGMQSKMTIQ